MLFNSPEFIYLFVPIVLLGFFGIARFGHRHAAAWLMASSLFFYGWWNPAYVGFLLGSIFFNYSAGIALAREGSKSPQVRRRWPLIIAVAANLFLLGYFKYANFFLGSANSLLATHWSTIEIILPLGISFFTFTQIAFLVDSWRGIAREFNFIHYGLFVTYFPHLIAGPVLHHKEMMPQFARAETYRMSWENLSVGLTIFAIGLFKKVVLADSLAVYATPVFESAGHGVTLGFLEAWGGALAYTLQLYFDFSGYSDMAIGLSRMFGVTLPLNFNSPYKSLNIIEFWRRWHMTLSRFLRDYLYFPLGGNRKGNARRYVNLMATMLLGGLWHGAGWTFVIWGGLHGVYLAINHAWHGLKGQFDLPSDCLWTRALAWSITFLAVIVAWVFFRANSLDAAWSMLVAMAGVNGVAIPGEWSAAMHWRINAVFKAFGIGLGQAGTHVPDLMGWFKILACLVVALTMPNTQTLMARYRPALDFISKDVRAAWYSFRPHAVWVGFTVFLLVAALTRGATVSEFLYFQF